MLHICVICFGDRELLYEISVTLNAAENVQGLIRSYMLPLAVRMGIIER